MASSDTPPHVNTRYKPHEKGLMTNSLVWHYFLIEMPSKETAKCKQCSKILKTHSGSTGNMITHLELHTIFLRKTSHDSKTELECPSSTSTTHAEPPKKRKITDHFSDPNEHSVEAAVSRMIARDGLPIHIICSSWDVRLGLMARGFSAVPKLPNTVRKLVLDYGKKIRHSVVGEMSREKAAEKKFSLTLDEWTWTTALINAA